MTHQLDRDVDALLAWIRDHQLTQFTSDEAEKVVPDGSAGAALQEMRRYGFITRMNGFWVTDPSTRRKETRA